MKENGKYLAFYALLIAILVLGFLQKPWLLIIPAALILSLAYIAVKGDTWRQVMGKGEMNSGLVFFGVLVSQLLTASILFGVGRLLAKLFS